MSKLGRYSADRKKIESVTEAKTVAVADCGTIFTITPGSSDYTVTLPTVSNAGKGWWCKFILAASGTAQVTVAQSTSDSNDLVYVRLSQTSVITSSITHHHAAAVGDGLGGLEWNADGLKFRSGSFSAIGDQVEFVTDGTSWYVTGHQSGSQNNLGTGIAPYHAA